MIRSAWRSFGASLTLGLVLSGVAPAQSMQLSVDVATARSAGRGDAVDAAVRDYAWRLERLLGPAQARLALRSGRRLPPLSPSPLRVVLNRGGVPLRSGSVRSLSPDLTLQFDSTGARAFPSDYRALLQTTFDQAKAAMNLIFGNPAVGGTVRVLNYDADIGDRDAVAGGVYVPVGTGGGPEIRFPVYQSREAAAVNFVHTLLLAYQGDRVLPFDGFQEGLVRAATMRIARTPAVTTGLDADVVDAVLSNTYDVGPLYDFWNQRALGARRFVAPNLINVPLPAGSSVGGVYLYRFLMAGSAWQKVLVEHPGFAREFNARWRAVSGTPDVGQLIQAGQAALNALRPSNPTVEGMSFGNWWRRQYVLDPATQVGNRLLVTPVPVTSGLLTGDFGVFDIQATWFSSDRAGNELLLRGTSYPIFWNRFFDRILPDAQSERMDIVAAYGSVVPNFTDDNAGRPYRVAVDLPVQDQLQRVYLPAGAVATAANPAGNDLWGVYLDPAPDASVSTSIRVLLGGTEVANAPVTEGAFGVDVASGLWDSANVVTLQVVRTGPGGTSIQATRTVNKAPGALGVVLAPAADQTLFVGSGVVPKGLSTVGFPVEPWANQAGDILGAVLVSRWDGATQRWALSPDVETFKQGHGYFVRANAAVPFLVSGELNTGGGAAVALRPGWNLISNPLNEVTPFSRVRVVKGTDFPKLYADALGVEVARDVFAFSPGSTDPATGAPETGSWVRADRINAGIGTFVFCNAPEGATLLFLSGNPGATPSRGPLGDVRASAAPNYRLRARLIEGPRAVESYLEVQAGATDGWDAALDSRVPPSAGGMQLGFGGGSRLFRDVRPPGGNLTSPLRLEGLRVGQSYVLELTEELRRARRLWIGLPNGRAQVISGVGRVTIRATAPKMTVSVRVEGA